MSLNSITLTVTNRPHYLERTLNALKNVSGIEQWQLFIGLEPGCDICAAMCREIDFMPVSILYNKEKLGIRANPYQVLKHAFDAGSCVNIYLEDDIVLSPDVGDLALWYKDLITDDELFDVKVFFMGLFVTSVNTNMAEELTVSDHFSPWGLVINRYQWEKLIEPIWWNDDHIYKGQQDWTLSISNQLHLNKNLVVLSPLLSRSTNIGREGGIHSDPERFDLLMQGLAMNHSKGPFQYSVTNKATVPRRRLNYTTMTVQD